MKKHLLGMAALAFTLASCSDDALNKNDFSENGGSQDSETTVSPVSRANLAAFASSQNRVKTFPTTRAALEGGKIELIAEIENLSKEEGRITGFVREENGRYLSATCVYYDPETEKYFVTYHMQGNNYYTHQQDQTSGFLETFTLNDTGLPSVETIYMAENPSELDFDFNHLLFDDTATDTYYRGEDRQNRLIAVGHKSEPSKKEGGLPNTAAIIARLNLEGSPTIEYATVYTGDKILDVATDTSLGNEDAADGNCVIRIYDWYYLATRKGIAVLNAQPDKLFEPVVDDKGHNYFIKTPGSAKFVYNDPGQYSDFTALYLTQDTPSGFDYETSIPAKLAPLHVLGYEGYLQPQDLSSEYIPDVAEFNILNMAGQIEMDNDVSPVDGKNAMSILDGQYFACLGKGGLFVKNSSSWTSGTIQFGDRERGGRPVNAVFVDGADDDTYGENHNGYIYVANGRCLSILDRATLEVVAEWSAPLDEEASANFIHVRKGVKNQDERRTERFITVAYGQAGVKVFKWIPPTKW